LWSHLDKCNIIPIDPNTGLAPNVPVQLYGYRQIVPGAALEIDPLMTGVMGEPFAKHCIVSFGWNKTISLGAGGALLTNDRQDFADFNTGLPSLLYQPLQRELEHLHSIIDAKKRMANYWDQHLGDVLPRLPGEVIIPWRTMRRVPNGKRD